MPDNFTIAVNDASVQQLLRQIKSKIENLKPVMQVIGDMVRTSVDQNFQAHGRYSAVGSWLGGTNKWEDTHMITNLRKLVKGRDPENILIDSGRLVSSITFQASQDSVRVGTNVEYAWIHQFGAIVPTPPRLVAPKKMTKKQKGYLLELRQLEKKMGGGFIKIPARPFLVVQPDDLENIKSSILAFISGDQSVSNTPRTLSPFATRSRK